MPSKLFLAAALAIGTAVAPQIALAPGGCLDFLTLYGIVVFAPPLRGSRGVA